MYRITARLGSGQRGVISIRLAVVNISADADVWLKLQSWFESGGSFDISDVTAD